MVYNGECIKEEVIYGVICVKLLLPVNNLVAAEDLLISYADYLRGSFEITKAIGYGKGHRLNNNENTRGITDYWEDAEKNKWKIKAWTNGNLICVLHVHSDKDLPEKKTEIFLEGLRFPGMK